MPDDGDALGDYPDLSHYKRYEDRDPYHHWDFPDMRRDFLEPVCRHYYKSINTTIIHVHKLQIK